MSPIPDDSLDLSIEEVVKILVFTVCVRSRKPPSARIRNHVHHRDRPRMWPMLARDFCPLFCQFYRELLFWSVWVHLGPASFNRESLLNRLRKS